MPKNNKKTEVKPSYSLNRSISGSTFKAEGPVNVGPNINGYGIGMSESLMNSLGLHEGDVVYFTIK